jgi:hypothetical protein
MGLAFGLDQDKLGLDLNLSPVEKVLEGEKEVES